jgi:hypothetical protein
LWRDDELVKHERSDHLRLPRLRVRGDRQVVTFTVVIGPPCGGKSTYIRERAKRGDVIIDLDRIALALSTEDTGHHDYPGHIRAIALQARQAALAAARRFDGLNVWLIHTDPSPQALSDYKRRGAKVVMCDPGVDECLRRAVGQRPAWVTWWRGNPATRMSSGRRRTTSSC